MPSSTVFSARAASFRLFIQVKPIAKIVAIADTTGMTISTTIQQAFGPSSLPLKLKTSSK